MFENRPEFVITWLGLSKTGAQIAWINFNLKYDCIHDIENAQFNIY
jgi:acyl-CoA synthetase (AMP-forming)/AMP-acid ligase II